MNVLLVLAHPDPASFNVALAATGKRALQAQGHEVAVSDLYAMGWKAVADEHDFAGDRHDSAQFRLDVEQTHAHERGTVAPDIAAEQAKVAAADLLILQFPLWWFGPPAILKGWFDRVFSRGFAYLPGRKYDTGMLAGKRALVSVTTGTSADTYASDGIDGALVDILWPITNGVLRYTGFEVYEPFATFMPRRMDDDGRTAALADFAAAMDSLATRPLLYFHPADHYGDDERLLPHVEPRSGFQHRG